MNVTITKNHEKNGIELRFDVKPENSVLETLREARWRYHRQKNCWYAKDTPENIALAEHIAGQSIPESSSTTEPEAYFPPYDTVGGIKIFKSSDVSCWDEREGYFCDINAYIFAGIDRVVIRDLTNALTPGKECPELELSLKDRQSGNIITGDMRTFREIYDRLFVSRESPDLDVYAFNRTMKSMHTFTPFKQINSIKTPKKWTIPHVWKAILSGQIFEGHCTGRYTDDYAYDAAVNFHEGRELNLPSFAKKLIEDPSGWGVSPWKVNGETITLSVCCYSFDMNEFQFDEKCDWAEGKRRADQREAELQAHNAELQSRVLSVSDAVQQAGSEPLLDVEYIAESPSTRLYRTVHAILKREYLLDENGELSRPFVSVNPYPISNTQLYEIDCDDELHNDERVFFTVDASIVTGLALKELLAGKTASMIHSVQLRIQTAEQLRETLVGLRDGRICVYGVPFKPSRMPESIRRMDLELDRAKSA